jgi:pimeloyl-ACP methyl ester carboxylesterase
MVLSLVGCGGSSSSRNVNTERAGGVGEPDTQGEEDLTKINTRIPSGAPPAALRASPGYAEPVSWPFRQGAPRTSGTGRYAYGAFYWSDFLYDANGPQGTPQSYRIGTPTAGGYTYPADTPNAYANGADIFRVGIGATKNSSLWRVDWQTLVDETVPIAAFALDTMLGGTAADEDWPGVPGLRSEGVDFVLLVSSDGAFLLDTEGKETALGPVSVDIAAQSFVIDIPHSVLKTQQGSPWTIRVASGLNDGLGRFRNTPESFGGAPGQTPVFNVAFRDYEDEPQANNSWFDSGQAAALTSGDVSAFAVTIDWSMMGETEPEPLLNGYSNRWYVSSLTANEMRDITSEPHFAERKWQPGGIYTGDDASSAIPQYFDLIQPYGIYVPEGVNEQSKRIPLTLMLHAFTQNHNQYASMPFFQQGICEERSSICVTPLGRGPAGYYFQDAEVDLWDVWHDVARVFQLDPDATVSSGFSMGALGTYRLLIRYPDLFAAGVILAGSQQSAVQPSVSGQGGAINCNAVGGVQLENIKWNDYYHAHGSFDELIPFAEARLTIDRMSELGYRYRFDHFLAEDHLVWTVKDQAYSAFATAATWLQTLSQKRRNLGPREIIYNWCLDEDYRGDSTLQRSNLGVGPVGPWWLENLQAANASKTTARVSAVSGAIADPKIMISETRATPIFDVPASPALRDELVWTSEGVSALTGTLTLVMDNVSQLGIDMAAAGLVGRGDQLICTQSSEGATLLLRGLPEGARIVNRAGTKVSASQVGVASIAISAGKDSITFVGSTRGESDCH